MALRTLLRLTRWLAGVSAWLLLLTGTAAAQAGVYVYVPNSANTIGGNSVSVYQTNAGGTLTLVTTLTDPAMIKPQRAAVSPDQRFAYVTGILTGTAATGRVFVVDVATQTFVQAIAAGPDPFGVAVSPDGTKVYVTNHSIAAGGNSVATYSVNASTGQLTAGPTIAMGLNTAPFSLVFTPDGTKVYVANQGTVGTNGSIGVIDVATTSLLTTITGGNRQPIDIVVNPAGTRVYVTDFSNFKVVVVDTATNTVVATPATGSNPYGIGITPDGQWFYVTDGNGSLVRAYDTATNSLITTAATGLQPHGVVVAPDSATLYVGNQSTSDNVGAFSITAGTGVPVANGAPLATGDNPNYMGICRTNSGTFATGATFAATATSIPCISADSVFTGGTLTMTAALGIDLPFTLNTGGMNFNVSAGNLATLIGLLSGTGGLTLTGSGQVETVAANTYSGPTAVNAGLLLLTGSTAASSAVTVAGGAQLGGAGTANGPVTIQSGGVLRPGRGLGQFATGNLSLNAGSSFEEEVAGSTVGTGYDRVNVTGTVTLGGTLTGSLGFLPTVGQVFLIIDNDGNDAIGGTFAGQAEGSTILIGGGVFSVSYVGGSGNDVTLTFVARGSATALTTSVTPSVFGQVVTFTATVSAISGPGTPTGTVMFKDGPTTLGTGTLNGSGVATFTTSTLSVGPHGNITAAYGGDTNFATSTSSALLQTVNQASSSTTLGSSITPSIFGQSVTFTATVTAVSPGSGTPTGTATFKDGTTTLGTGILNGSGVATFSTSLLSAGPHSITVVYAGDTNFATSTSSAVSQAVNQASSTTTLSSSVNPSTFGQSVTFTATVAAVPPGGGAATGTATFKDGSVTLGTGTLVGGVATFPTSTLSAGTHNISVTYGGDANFGASTSGSLTQTVGKVNQTITFGPLSSKIFGAAAFPVSASASSGLGVTFSSQTTGVCIVSVNTVTLVSLGTCTIAADQAGDANYNPATRVTQSFLVAANCAGVSLAPAQLGVALTAIPYSQTLTLTNGTAPFTFSLSGALPAGLTFTNGVFSGTPAARGAFAVTATATDANGCQASADYSLAVSAERRLLAATGAGAAGAVRAFNVASGTPRATLAPFGTFAGGVSVAQGDTNGDGVPDTLTGAGPGGAPVVTVVDGASGQPRLSFVAFDPAFRGGVEVAAGDVTGDGLPEILVVAGCTSAFQVRAFNGVTGALVRDYPFTPSVWGCGLHVAAGDVNGDGIADLIVGSGGLGPAFVDVIDGASGAVLRELFPFTTAFTGGVYVAAGDVNGDGVADIVTGAGPGGSPDVRVFDGTTGAPIAGALASFAAYAPGFAGGVRVAAGDLNGDGRAEIITAPGPGGGPHVRVWDGATAAEIYGLYAFDPLFAGGVFVAGPTPSARMNVDIPAVRTTGTGVRIAGWALREIATDTTGTDAIHAWALPIGGGAPVFVGAAPARTARPDVAAVFGGEFLMSGFDFTGTLASGTYDLIVYARNTRTQKFDQARVVRITVQ